MREQFDFGAILEQNGVTPIDDSPYELSDFVNAFKNSLQIEPVIACFNNNITNKQFLGEMHICLNKQFHLINCRASFDQLLVLTAPLTTGRMKRNVVDGKGEIPCNISMPIYYPTIIH